MDMEQLIKIVQETERFFFDDNLRGDVKAKGESDFVTRADIETSEYLQKRLSEEFPHIGFMSEEEEGFVDNGQPYWILDPIDGTTNFMHGIGICALSLGLCEKGEITAGVIWLPYLRELFWAQKGEGAYLNGERIFCSKNDSLSESLTLYEFNPYFKEDAASAMEYAEKLYTECQDMRCFGSAAVELAYVACGRAEAFLGRYLKPWDIAAGVILIREAGGRIGDIEGELRLTEMNRHIIAANSFVYDDFWRLLKE